MPANRVCGSGTGGIAATGKPRRVHQGVAVMKQTSRISRQPEPKDAPRAGFTCASYRPGHSVHYFPVVKRAPQLVPIEAAVEVRASDLLLTALEGTQRVWSHNKVAVTDLIQQFGSSCLWYPTLGLACWPQPEVRHWVNLSTGPLSPCFSVEEAQLAELEAWS